MTDERHQADDDFYIPTPKEVAMKRGKRRLRRAANKPTKAQGPKHPRRLKGRNFFKVSKRVAENRTEAPPPRPSVPTKQIPDPSASTEPTTPISPESPPATTVPTPTEEKIKRRDEPKIPSSDAPSTKLRKDKRVRPTPISRPYTAEQPALTPTELLPPEGRERATYMAEKQGHKLAPWESTRTLGGRDETHWTECNECKLEARATLVPQVASSSLWQYEGEALKVPCDG